VLHAHRLPATTSHSVLSRRYDPEGKYIRHFLPILKDMPAKYIYEPWTAPEKVQREANCIIGKDYPAPIVDHKEALDANKAKMKDAYAAHREGKDGAAEKKDAYPEDKTVKTEALGAATEGETPVGGTRGAATGAKRKRADEGGGDEAKTR
jgi:cryptochrome